MTLTGILQGLKACAVGQGHRARAAEDASVREGA